MSDSKSQLTLFYSSKSPFSNFYKCKFDIDGKHSYCCSEQYYMHQKAMFFKDYESAERILNCENPAQMKRLGRRIKNFHDDEWKDVCRSVMKRALWEKFSQTNLAAKLLQTTGTEMVEASPSDCRWGVGLSANNPKIMDKKLWRGQNWLGKLLDEVRSDLAKYIDNDFEFKVGHVPDVSMRYRAFVYPEGYEDDDIQCQPPNHDQSDNEDDCKRNSNVLHH